MSKPLIDYADPERLFADHRPSPENLEKLKEVRRECLALGLRMQELVPICPERTLAIRCLHQASMHANYALVSDDPVAE